MLAHKTFLLCLAIVVVVITEARTIKKGPKKIDKKLQQTSKTQRENWPFEDIDEDECDEVSTLDTAYHLDKRAEYEVESWPNCGLNRNFSRRSENTKLGKMFRSFQEYLDDLIESVKEVKESRKLKSDEKDGEGDRIVGGTPVKPGTWPWLVAVGTFAPYVPRCGGTVIADSWVMTAAHCFEDREQPCKYTIRVGATNWGTDPPGHAQDRRVVGIYRHPDYDSETNQNDIALLQLEEPLDLDPKSYVNSICLPNRGRSVTRGTPLFAAGWGTHKQGVNNAEGDYDALQVKLPMIGYEDSPCGKYARDRLKKGMLCAGYVDGSKDTCQGDSGGPLTYQKDGIWYQLGVTSFGDGCAKKGYPGVYTDVGQYLDWLTSCVSRYSNGENDFE